MSLTHATQKVAVLIDGRPDFNLLATSFLQPELQAWPARLIWLPQRGCVWGPITQGSKHSSIRPVYNRHSHSFNSKIPRESFRLRQQRCLGRTCRQTSASRSSAQSWHVHAHGPAPSFSENQCHTLAAAPTQNTMSTWMTCAVIMLNTCWSPEPFNQPEPRLRECRRV